MIIPAYNEEERIASTLTSVQNQTLKAARVIVIDDHSSDRTGQIARDMHVEVIRPEKHCGSKASAQNAALPMVNTRYVAALDADTILTSDALEKMLQAMEKTNATGSCSWVQTRYQSTIWQWARTVEYLFAFVWFKRVQEFYKRPVICSGAFNMFKTSTLKMLGATRLTR